MNEIVKKETAHIEPITPMTLIQAAQEKEVSIEKMEQLFELQMKWEAAEAVKAYNRAMAAFRAECPRVKKTKEGYGYMYAPLSDTLEIMKPLIAKNGLSYRWETGQSGDTISVRCIVTHTMGHSEGTMLSAKADSSGSKNGIQAMGSTVSYLEKYTFNAMFGIASGDQDDDGQKASAPPVKTISEEQMATIQSLLSELGKSEEDFLKWEGATDIESIPASRYDRAIKAINKLVNAK